MAQKYSQVFTLTDIFNNKELKDKIPLINYKETIKPNGKISRTTRGKTVNTLVFTTAVKGARPFYKPLVAHRSGDTMSLGGTLIGDYDDAYNSVYEALKDIRPLLSLTANNADMIRDALKEAEKRKRSGGQDTLLYLKEQSMAQIKAKSVKATQYFINEIMENIMFSDNFPKTQEKYGVRSWTFTETISKNYHHRGMLYDKLKENWERKVGIINGEQ